MEVVMRLTALFLLCFFTQPTLAKSFDLELSAIEIFACRVTLCLSAVAPPEECDPFLKEFWDIIPADRPEILDLCPIVALSDDILGDDSDSDTSNEEIYENASYDETIDVSSLGGATGPSEQMLWKPESESDHKLVVLIPASYRAVKVSIYDAEGNLIERGDFEGRTNGRRPTYRFTKPGKSYPDPCYLRVGDKVFSITNPGGRHESLTLVSGGA
jgi:hypothetical protein